jgi:hypothetical protein
LSGMDSNPSSLSRPNLTECVGIDHFFDSCQGQMNNE